MKQHGSFIEKLITLSAVAFVVLLVLALAVPMGLQTRVSLADTEIPEGATINSATLNVFINYVTDTTAGVTVFVHRITDPWTEMDATWDNFGGSYDPTEIGSFEADGTGWRTVDISNVVQEWVDGTYPNYGLLLKQKVEDGDNWTEFLSSEYNDVALRPFLEIEYSVDGSDNTIVIRREITVHDDVVDTKIRELDPYTNYGNEIYLHTATDQSAHCGNVHVIIKFLFTIASATTPPAVTTNDAADENTDTATLNGYLDDLGTASSVDVSFEWGLDTNYGNETTPPETMTEPGALSVPVSGLSANTTYHFRTKAVGDGTSYGDDIQFTTSADSNQPPVADVGIATTGPYNSSLLRVWDVDKDGVENVTLNGSSSYDPDGDIVSYEWKEGSTVLSTEESFSHSFTVGSHFIILTVTDNDGATGYDPLYVVVKKEIGCFIATAAYGTPMAEEIQVLRDFRDQYLLTNPVGESIVELYYKTSPPVADFIADHPALKQMVRTGLEPVIVMSTIAIHTTLAQKIAVVGLMMLLSILLILWFRRRAGSSSIL